MVQLRYIVFGCTLILTSWACWSGYRYFFDTKAPHFAVAGVDNGGYYCGDIQGSVVADKKGTLSVWLDGQPLLTDFSVASSDQEHPFTIPTRALANGEHSLRAEFCDTTYHRNNASFDHIFYVDNQPLQAAFVKSDTENRVFQGRTLHLQFQVNKPIEHACVHALSHTYACFSESKNSSIYECFIPIPCEEAPNEYLLAVEIFDHVGNKLGLESKFQVVMYPFKKQTLAISKEKVKEEKEAGLSIIERERKLAELAMQSVQEKLWRGAFCPPVDVNRVSCEFGTIRTTQEKGRYMHKALDVLSAPKSIVWSTQAGIVALKDRYEDTGNTVVIDHGYGVLSLFCHLDEFAEIQVGQKVAQGNPVGTLGKTGYATGYHLHWEMRVNNVEVDPMQWTKVAF